MQRAADMIITKREKKITILLQGHCSSFMKQV